MTRTLDVYLEDALVGRLTQDDAGQLAFRYDPAWLGSAEARPLSQSLPLSDASFDHARCRPFFAGLLPEGEPRDLVARRLGVTARNDFALLDRIGGEVAGAVSFVPGGTSRAGPPSRSSYRPLSTSDLADILRTLPDRPLLAGEEGVRLSLAGAQAKVPVLAEGDTISVPLDGAPSSHIVKPRIRWLPDTVHNEAFCLALARRLGLYVVDAEIRNAGGEPYLLVARYDRLMASNGRLRRLHQEDFCQALGIPPERKYQSEGGPSLAQCFELVRRTVSRPAVDLGRLLDFVILNVIVGNHDAHGKNYSLLYAGRSVALAPLYDVTSTVAYPELSPRLAMKIGNTYDPERIVPRYWDQFATEAGLGPAIVRRRLASMAARLPDAARATADAMRGSGFPSGVVDQVVDGTLTRATALRDQLDRYRAGPR